MLYLLHQLYLHHFHLHHLLHLHLLFAQDALAAQVGQVVGIAREAGLRAVLGPGDGWAGGEADGGDGEVERLRREPMDPDPRWST